MALHTSAIDRISAIISTPARALLALWPIWARALCRRWRISRSIRATGLLLDWMDDGALEELGVRRIGRGVRWLDHCEAVSRGDFEYRFPVGETARRERIDVAGSTPGQSPEGPPVARTCS